MRQERLFVLGYIGFFLIMLSLLALFLRCGRIEEDQLIDSSSAVVMITTEDTTTTLLETTTTETFLETTETLLETTTESVSEITTTELSETTTTSMSATTTSMSTTEATLCADTTISTTETSQLKKSVLEIAYEVWRGDWGNGEERKRRLEEAGYDYEEVQRKVCEIRSEETTPPIESTQISATQPVSSTTTQVAVQSDWRGTFIKTFNRGTYYCYGYACKGGSGRDLIDCSYGDGTVRGSIASSYLYRQYGYERNGRTKVYLEIPDYPQMNGFYYLDDSDAGDPEVIDFFYIYASNCPFQYQGVVKVNAYLP